MANSKLPVEQNLDSSLVADGYEGIGHDHNLAMDSSHNSGSGDLHMGTHGNPNLGWEHANGDGLELGYTKENHIAPQNPYIHQVKDDGEYLDRVDNPAGVNNLNGDIQAYDNQLALSHHLALSENHEMTNVGFGNQDVAENVDVNMEENQERSNVVTTESVEQAELVLDPPVLQIRSLAQMENHELTIGQEFPDAKSCRRAVRNAAIALRFEVQTFKSDKTRFTAKCATEGCPWRIHAAKLPGLPTFSIRTIHDHHTCVGIAHLGHQQASVQWVADTLAEHIKQNPQCKPKEILEEIHRVHGITLSYKQAWRGKERIMAAIRGSFEEDYRLLPQYCDQVQKANPGSIALVYSNPNDGSFQHLFISFQASIYGFLNACRPLIGLDKTCLKSKDLGSILLATGFDGEGAVFPLAFAVVDEENDDNWTWFLFELHKLLEINTDNMPKLTILSNRKRCIVDGVEANFPTAFHGFCLHYLAESFHKEFNNSILLPLFWEAAAALTVIEFETKILEIQHISPSAALWIQNIPYTLWTTSHFEGKR
ncbi:uncharacterized protein LOC110811875, partial [Carica papaya]|uniref:uncharacterized protein LOC110811875 n=1 Tax=Carica papaya TaxID=3649 RepID=UPI000B8CBDB5